MPHSISSAPSRSFLLTSIDYIIIILFVYNIMHNIMLWGGGATLLSLANRSKERRSSIVEYILASLVFDACLVLCWKCRRTDGRKSRMRMLPRREHRVLRQTSWIENVYKTFYPIRLFFPQDEEQRRCTVCGRTLFMNCQSAAQLYYLSHHKNEWMAVETTDCVRFTVLSKQQ